MPHGADCPGLVLANDIASDGHDFLDYRFTKNHWMDQSTAETMERIDTVARLRDRPYWHFVIVVVVALVVLFTGLGASRLWDRDEPRNAGCAAEMMARGDWVVPIFNDELRPQKPVLLYWLIMASYAAFGQSEWAARLPSALMGLGTVIVTWRIGCRLAGPGAGLLSALVLMTSLMFLVASRAATPDATLIFLSTLAIGIYVHAVFAPDGGHGDGWFPKSMGPIVAMYAVLGLAVLAKGPVGLIVPMAIIGMFMLIQRLPSRSPEATAATPSRLARWRHAVAEMVAPFQPRHFFRTLWTMKPWVAIVATLLIAAPWYVLVGLRTEGDFLWQFFWTENIGRATTSFENHSGGPWYYPVAILVGFFPWSVLALPLAIQIRSDWNREAGGLPPSIVLLLCWAGVQVGLFTLASTKLPSYVTPCYPALALLTGICLDRWIARASRVGNGWFALGTSGLVTGGVFVAVALYFVGDKVLEGDWRVALVGVPLIIGGAVATGLTIRDRRAMAMGVFVPTAVAFVVGMFGIGTGWVDQHRQTEQLWSAVERQMPAARLATFRCLESSWVFYAGRPIHELEPDPSRAATTMDRTKSWKKKPWVTPQTFAAEPDALIVTTDEHVAELESLLQADVEIIESVPFFLKPDRRLLLVRPLGQSRTAVRPGVPPK